MTNRTPEELIERLIRSGVRPALARRAVGIYSEFFPRKGEPEAKHLLELLVFWPRAAWEVVEAAAHIDSIRHGREGSDGVLQRFLRQDQYWGARSEALAARHLVAAGLPFRFIPSHDSRPTPDIEVVHSSSFAVEVMHLEPTGETIAESAMTFAVCTALEGFEGYNVEIDLDGEGFDTVLSYGDRIGAGAANLGNQVASRLIELMENGVEGTFDLRGIGTAQLSRVETPGWRVEPAWYFARPRKAPGKFKGALTEKARKQLPPDGLPGVLFVDLSRSIGLDEASVSVRNLMETFPDAFRGVSGMVLCESRCTLDGVHEETVPVPNPSARVRLSDLPWATARERRQFVIGPGTALQSVFGSRPGS